MSALVEWWTVVVPTLSVVALVLALGIVVKAIRGYRQNSDPAMLLLAIGLFLLVLAPFPVEITALTFFDETVEAEIGMTIVQQVLRVAGLGAILASMYVRR